MKSNGYKKRVGSYISSRTTKEPFKAYCPKPLLYLSLYLKNNHETYYALLQKVRIEWAWEEWVLFFLKAVIETVTQATDAIVSGAEIFRSDMRLL